MTSSPNVTSELHGHEHVQGIFFPSFLPKQIPSTTLLGAAIDGQSCQDSTMPTPNPQDVEPVLRHGHTLMEILQPIPLHARGYGRQSILSFLDSLSSPPPQIIRDNSSYAHQSPLAPPWSSNMDMDDQPTMVAQEPSCQDDMTGPLPPTITISGGTTTESPREIENHENYHRVLSTGQQTSSQRTVVERNQIHAGYPGGRYVDWSFYLSKLRLRSAFWQPSRRVQCHPSNGEKWWGSLVGALRRQRIGIYDWVTQWDFLLRPKPGYSCLFLFERALHLTFAISFQSFFQPSTCQRFQ
ncbi:hypothetical protein CPB84DRAFT_1790459 [Gymnopilus junonius]|uniref:Uncharacterized protein n=1 Tax=Gymnopilus junonius TaxID=109634 RepID=A0A9P5ND00_GYMJU|nr:hypothetical protein CPB84DRAFT_1790459 [Gymnopilus junonius]